MPSTLLMPRLSVEDLRSTIKTLRKEKRNLGVQVRSLTRRLATAEKKIVGQRSKKPKKTLQRDAQVPPPVKVLPNSYLTVSPEGKVVEIAMPVHIDSKVVWARWP